MHVWMCPGLLIAHAAATGHRTEIKGSRRDEDVVMKEGEGGEGGEAGTQRQRWAPALIRRRQQRQCFMKRGETGWKCVKV